MKHMPNGMDRGSDDLSNAAKVYDFLKLLTITSDNYSL